MYNNIIPTKKIFMYDIILDENFPEAAGIDLNGEKIYFNPSLYESFIDYVEVFTHEILHDLLEHHKRLVNFLGDPEKLDKNKLVIWNIAADHIVNKMYIQLLANKGITNKYGESKFRNGLINLDYMNDPRLDDMSVEILYRYLLDRLESKTEEISGTEQSKDDKSDSSSGKFKVLKSTIMDKKTGNILHQEYTIVIPKNINQKKSSISKSGVIELSEHFKSIGFESPVLKAEYEFIKTPVSLKPYLIHYLSLIRQGMDDSSFFKYSKLNTVLKDIDVVLPASVTRKVKVIIGVDSSGSISEEEYSEFISIIYNNREVIDGHIFICDARIHAHYDIQDKEPDQIVKEIKKIKTRKGYGGTSVLPVFEKLNDYPDTDVLIYFTDLWVDFPRKPRCKVLWVVKKTSQTMFKKVPFGKIIWF